MEYQWRVGTADDIDAKSQSTDGARDALTEPVDIGAHVASAICFLFSHPHSPRPPPPPLQALCTSSLHLYNHPAAVSNLFQHLNYNTQPTLLHRFHHGKQ